MIQSIKKRLARINPKQFVVAAGFAVALFGAIGLGTATKQLTSASGIRDTGTNPILNQGSIGCLTIEECVSDFRANKPSDVQDIFTNRGLSPDEYSRFAQSAKPGKVYKNGNIVVDGQIVATDAWSMGREKFNDQRVPLYIGGKTYYMSPTSSSFASDSLDAFVMFNDQGMVEFAILTACGNPTWGNNKRPEYGCKSLNKTPVADKKNTYNFTTTLEPMKLATVNKLVYDFGDGTPTVTETNPSKSVQHTYTKVGTHTATVTVYFNLPGGKIATSKCKTTITVLAPFYSCDVVLPRELNAEKTKFRFTVKASAGNGATLKDADFTLDGTSTVTGVTTKDENGNIYKEYEFARDGKDHTVVVKVNFNLAEGV
ncbi:MAG TPA: PKD domain-containing protein, partial [Candidatus Saccharimonadales bacterium]|nr:PKD domain-containing protein [Candidatus Saccharimonadales bacterium]